jgi:hypothetical protein
VSDDPLGNSFTQNVTLGNGTTTIDNGALTLTQTLVPTGANAEWLVLDYQATGVGLIGGNPNITQSYSATGATSSLTVLSQFFFNWTVNGALINSITNGVFPETIEADPINPSLGNVFSYSGGGTDGNAPAMSWNLYDYVSPYSKIDGAGVDVGTATGFVFAGLVTNTSVPEPSSLVLAGIASVAVMIWKRSAGLWAVAAQPRRRRSASRQ